ncbi:MAG: DUF805 domain-containing protein [Rhodospirillales bacterium]|nr:DUF805 domain-containing protein [Rhodospirillales bacterium]
MSWFIGALKKYAVFEGRARRKEYWFFVLFYVIFALGLGLVEVFLGPEIYLDEAETFGLLSGLYGLGMLVPSISVTVRRLHDSGRSGWWVLIGLIPLIGAIVLLVFMVLESQEGDNRFGPNPKEAAAR